MGLLVGTITDDSVAHVAGVHILTRSDKRKDRCEISATQLAGASAEAERLSTITGHEVRIIGWYHSHPHITVLPSHVDVRTQGMWQMMDDAFVGLIFSVFNEEASKTQRIQMIAFQSVEVAGASVQTFTQRDVPIKIVRHGWPQTLLGVRSPYMLSTLTRILYEEQKTMATQSDQKARSVLEKMQGASIHHKFLSKFLEYNVLPLRQYFASCTAAGASRLDSLAAETSTLQHQLAALKVQVTQKTAEKVARELGAQAEAAEEAWQLQEAAAARALEVAAQSVPAAVPAAIVTVTVPAAAKPAPAECSSASSGTTEMLPAPPTAVPTHVLPSVPPPANQSANLPAPPRAPDAPAAPAAARVPEGWTPPAPLQKVTSPALPPPPSGPA